MGVAAIVLLGFTLRLWRLAHLGDLEFDEIVSVQYATLPGSTLLPLLAGALFEHPPAFYLALGWWRWVFGPGDTAARLSSILPGTLTIPLTYAVGAHLRDRRTGLIAALLVAVAPLPLFYSREARMYALVAALGLASLWLFLRGLQGPSPASELLGQGTGGSAADQGRADQGRADQGRPRPGVWLAYGVIGALTAYVHYLGALQMAGQLLVAILLRRRLPHALRPVVITSAGIVLLALPWVLAARGTRESLPALALHNVAALPGALWAAWRDLAAGPDSAGVPAIVGALTLLALVLAGFPRRPIPGTIAGAMLATGLAGLVFVIALGKPVQARYVMPIAPLAFILAAGALRRGGVTLALGGLGLLLGFAPFWARYYTGYARADYSSVTRRIAALERPGDGVLLTGPWQAWYFDYYYTGSLGHEVLPRDAPPALDPERARTRLEALVAEKRRLWFVQAGLAQADPTNFVERWLLRHAWPATREAHQNAVLSHYALQAPRVTRPLRPVTYGGRLRLVGGWVDGEEVPAGDVVRLLLELELLQPAGVDLKGSLRLVGIDGQRAAVDFDLLDRRDVGEQGTSAWGVGQRVLIRRGIWVPASLGPQPYSVRLVVYDPTTLLPLLPGVGDDGATGQARGEAVAPEGRAGDLPGGGEAPVADVYVTQSLAALPPGAESPFRPIGRRFGGGDEFDALELVGVRAAPANPSAEPLTFDLLWRLDGLSGTEHRSTIAVVDTSGRVWAEETRPLFGGTFAMHDWREGETLAERRAVDLTAFPPGGYRILVGLVDSRGRALPAGAGPDMVELARFELPYRRPLGERLVGLWQRLTGRRRRDVPLRASLGRGRWSGVATRHGAPPGRERTARSAHRLIPRSVMADTVPPRTTLQGR